ncbi:MAG: hypothetical protein E7013_05715 [Alphaproteobacteria bacterium]|nr:hypothetical protein [Alphaproteobacteria bacterium]
MNMTAKERHNLLVKLIALSSRRLEENGNFSLYPVDAKTADLWRETYQKLMNDANTPIKIERDDKITFPYSEEGRMAGYAFLRSYHEARNAGIESNAVKEVMEARKNLTANNISFGNPVAKVIKDCVKFALKNKGR